MEWLNYHHLLYFWVVAREGSIAAACRVLFLSQPTISGQIRELERFIGTPLFKKAGRGLVLTDTGQAVYRYADEIFTLGQELLDTVRGRPVGRPLRLRVGVVDALPKLMTHSLLTPALKLAERLQVVCTEGKLDALISQLVVHQLDVVLSDAPLPPTVSARAYNHLLGECEISIFGTRELTSQYRRGFPSSLANAPFLMPSVNSALRRSLDHWLEHLDLRVDIRGEFDDSSLLKTFGQEGEGIFAAPAAVEHEVCRQYRVQVIGRVKEVHERFYAISVERKLKHPAVLAISASARERLEASGRS